MVYNKTTWVNNTEPGLNATNLNHIETGIDEAHDAVDNTVTGHDHDGVNSKKVDSSDVINTPAGNVIATDVQAAITELDGQDTTIQGNLTTHEALPNAHHNEIHSIVSHDTTVTGAELDADHSKLTGVENNAKDDQTGAEIKALYEAEVDTNAYTDAAVSKVAGIDAGADVTADNPPQTHSMATHTDEGALATLNTVDTAQVDDDSITYAKMQNVSADERILGNVTAIGSPVAELTKAQVLNMLSVEDGATADQTGAEIKTAYEAEANAYTNTKDTKLTGIDTGADVTGDNPPQAHDLDSHGSCTLAELSADLSDATLIDTGDARLSDARTPQTHETSHKAAGSDEILLDEFGTPTDVTTLNSTTSTHGLLPKLDNVVTNFLNGQGGWSAPTGGNVTSGTYTGNGTQNRAIAHGLGVIPKMVIVYGSAYVTARFQIYMANLAQFITVEAGATRINVTASDSTNFYVGTTSGGYNNDNSELMYWTAIA